jgi:bifunctional oligoribonuclease and PAP phosphatase NrnA
MEARIKKIIDDSKIIVIIQPDNPDGDSVASVLALEQTLSEQGKTVHMYCGMPVPTYLRYLEGWDRIYDELPVKFDSSIIVDTSAIGLLEFLTKTESLGWVKSKPCIVLDHHTATEPTIDFADVMYLKPAVAAGEVVYELSESLKWKRNAVANYMIAAAILSDSLGLTSEGTSSRSIQIISELVAQGVSIPKLENDRRALQKKSQGILNYKAKLLDRIEYSSSGRIAYITIPWDEIEKYSQEYNPPMLVLDEMRQVKDVAVAIAFKIYPDGRITAKLRASYGYGVAAEVAQHFGGGGHPYAAGFKISDGRPFNELKSECIKQTELLLDKLVKDSDDENIQYAYTVG